MSEWEPTCFLQIVLLYNQLTVCAMAKSDYFKTVEEQTEHLKELGLIISDDSKAYEILSDIGYYRFGFYMFPFEKSIHPKTVVIILSKMAFRFILSCAFITLILNLGIFCSNTSAELRFIYEQPLSTICRPNTIIKIRGS